MERPSVTAGKQVRRCGIASYRFWTWKRRRGSGISKSTFGGLNSRSNWPAMRCVKPNTAKI